MKKANYIVIDCETGGLFSKTEFESDGSIKESKDKDGKTFKHEANPITQIAVQTLDHLSFKELNRFETFVQPYNNLKITQKALEASMVSMAQINKGMDHKKLVKFLIEYFKNANKAGVANKPILVGHNLQFDIGFLVVIFELCGHNLWDYVNKSTTCTQVLAKETWNYELVKDDISSIQLGACCKRAGIKLTDAHGAMNDVVATGKLFVYFINRLRAGGNTTIENNAVVTETKGRDFYQF